MSATMRLRFILLSGLVVLLSAVLTRAAVEPEEAVPLSQEWQFRAWQTDEGLPDNSVTGVAQAEDGYLWVATFGGLMRFNGARFEEFSLLHLPDVPNRVVRQMRLDSAGRLWLAMDRGSLVWADQSRARVITPRDGLHNTRITCMADDGRGGLWLAYPDGVVRVADGKVSPLTTEAGIPAEGNYWVAADGQGKVWIASGNQLGLVREGRWDVARVFPQTGLRLTRAGDDGLWVCAGNALYRFVPGGASNQLAQLPEHAAVQALLEDHAGALWIATASDGLFHWRDGRLEKVPTSNSQISSLAEDREGNLWVGTAGGGLNRLRARTVEVIGMDEGLPYESMRSVCEDTNGVRWAVTDNGLLLRHHEERWEIAGRESGWTHGAVANCVAAGPDGSVWVGTSIARLVRLRQGESREWRRPQKLAGSSVRSILVAANGDVWVATSGPSRLHRLQGDVLQPVKLDQEVRSSLRAMAETADGTIWAGAAEGVLVRVNPATLKGECFFPEERPLSIRFLSATPEGSLWIGYAGWGLGRWKDGRHARITAAQGLYDDYISQMLPDERGNLWLNGNHGLFVVRLSELIDVFEGRGPRVRSISYGRGEGLPSLQPRCDFYPSGWRMASGSLFFALRNGLAVVRSQKMVENQRLPPVVVERVAIDERTLARHAADFPLRPSGEDTNEPPVLGTGALLTVPPRHQKIEIEFAALSFSSPENVQFRYRLKNFDQGWSDAGGLRNVRYPRLPAGDYEFEVEACNEAGLWNAATQPVALRVLPFFWQTWWFRLVAVLLFTGGVIGLVRYFSFRRLRRELARLEQQELLHRERARIARDMHDEVGAKLSRLSLLSDLAGQQTALPVPARDEVREISDTAREAIRSFDEIVWAVNPRNDTLANLGNYLCRFAEEFFEGSPVQCTFDLPADLPALKLSTEERHHVFLAAKEALNNIAKHAEARHVMIRMRVEPDAYEIEIADDGRGLGAGASRTAGGGNGLNNMRERMNLMGGTFILAGEPGRGTRVLLRVPRARPASRA
jgi:signal transduction histidine kinase/ligand-binding sensor domain-containing protein